MHLSGAQGAAAQSVRRFGKRCTGAGAQRQGGHVGSQKHGGDRVFSHRRDRSGRCFGLGASVSGSSGGDFDHYRQWFDEILNVRRSR